MVDVFKDKYKVKANNSNNVNYTTVIFDKIKNLRPTLREKHRYVKYKVILNNFKSDSNSSELEKKDENNTELEKFKENCHIKNKFNLNTFVLRELNLILGVFDSARAGLVSISSEYNMTGIIRCSTKSLETVKLALNLITEIKLNSNEYQVSVNILRVGGTLKSMNKKLK